jgi:hypothetical protein
MKKSKRIKPVNKPAAPPSEAHKKKRLPAGRPAGHPTGRSNNPAGRPKGVPNKLSGALRERIINFLNEDFDKYINTLHTLEDRDRVKVETELFRLVVPRPVDDNALDALRQNITSPLVARLFLSKADDPES